MLVREGAKDKAVLVDAQIQRNWFKHFCFEYDRIPAGFPYRSPKDLEGDDTADSMQQDVWALGVIVLEVIFIDN
jgi:hypothetical protein